ncbi:NAD-dependent epimerase/dehydratase family protein [Streptomyces sp. TRM72054]
MVTGARGRIGAAVVARLTALGASVIAVDRAPCRAGRQCRPPDRS